MAIGSPTPHVTAADAQRQLKKEQAASFGQDDQSAGFGQDDTVVAAPKSDIVTAPIDKAMPNPLTEGHAAYEFIPGVSLLKDLVSPKKSAEVYRASQAGVDYETGAPTQARALASLASSNSQQSLDVLGGIINKDNQGSTPGGKRKGTPTRIGPQTGEWEYLNPKTKRWTLFNPPGGDLGDLSAFIPDAGKMITEVLGTMAGTTAGAAAGAGGGPAGVAVGGGAGGVIGGGMAAFAGEYARLKAGQYYGLNQDLSDDQMIGEAAKSAGLSVAGGTAGLAMAAVAKKISNYFAGRVFSEETSKVYGPGIEKAKALEGEINPRIQGAFPEAAPLKFDLAQATDDPQLLATKEALLRTPNPRQAEFIAGRDAQSKAINDFFTTINLPYSPSADAMFKVGRATKQALQTRYGAATGASGARVTAATADAEKALGVLPRGNAAAASAEIAKGISEQQVRFKAWASKAAQDLDHMIGPSPVIHNTETAAVAESLDEGAKNALFPSLHKPTERLTGPRIVGLDDQGQEVLGKLFDPNAKFTFQEAWGALSDLKRAVRIAEKSTTTQEPNVAAMKRLVGALENDLHDSLRGPYAAAYDAFRARYSRQIGMLDTLSKNASLDQPLAVFDNLFKKGDAATAGMLHAAISEDPAAMATVRKAIFEDYRKNVVDPKTGLVDTAKHNRWLDDHYEQAAPFLSGQDGDMLRAVGGARELATREAARDSDYQKRLGQTFGMEMLNADPMTIMRKVYGPQKGEQIRQFMKIATPEAQYQMRQAVLSDLDSKVGVRVGDQTTLSYAKLKTYLYGGGPSGEMGHANALRQVMGNRYMDDMETLYKALETAQREVVGRAPSGTPYASGSALEWMLKQGSRAVFGPLSPIQRKLTFAFRARDKAVNNMLADVIQDPDKLAQVVSLRRMKPSSRQAATILGQLGLLELLDSPQQ